MCIVAGAYSARELGGAGALVPSIRYHLHPQCDSTRPDFTFDTEDNNDYRKAKDGNDGYDDKDTAANNDDGDDDDDDDDDDEDDGVDDKDETKAMTIWP
ncbi:hypothetical protein ElyMa_004973700 [Elysia marginata]|uniref:Uncharacterized protein n=1 Tax=Elysia marginata TaxID=1093978 RepID=A0AAV4J592_9GAST|nr:hypothetical protein ElyMa_004973700 [Elysia marginata]